MEKIISRKKGRSLELGARKFYLLFLPIFALPVIITCCFSLVYDKGFEVVLLFSSILAISLSFSLLHFWESRMRGAVGRLVEERCRALDVMPSNQLEQLKKQYHQAALSYEHQIDLLQSSVQKSKEQVTELNLEMDKKLEQMRFAYLEFEDLRQEYSRLGEEYDRYKIEIQSQIKHKETLLADYQHTITEQRSIIEKKQHYIAKLEGKVRDLMYEIRGLLQIDDPLLEKIPLAKEEDEPDLSHERRPYDFTMQLGKYLEMAEEFTGVGHLGGRFLDSMANQYAIDLRPLIDRLREEMTGILFVYAPVDNKFLFINKMVKIVLGWSGEKFTKDFREIVQMGYADWERAISEIPKEREKKLRLVFRTKSSGEKPLDCYMGLIRKGPFANFVIGLML